MAAFQMSIKGYDENLGRFRRAIEMSTSDARSVTQEYANKFLEAVKQNASGRPGPNVITGQYRSSIHLVEEGAFTIGVATSEPYAARLEFGYSGVDAIGRHYNQGAFPHWTPAKDQIAPEYQQAMADRAKRWFA